MTDVPFDNPFLEKIYNNLVEEMRSAKKTDQEPFKLVVNWEELIRKNIDNARKDPEYQEEIGATNMPPSIFNDLFPSVLEIYPDKNRSHVRYFTHPDLPIIIIEKNRPQEDNKTRITERKIRFFGDSYLNDRIENIKDLFETN